MDMSAVGGGHDRRHNRRHVRVHDGGWFHRVFMADHERILEPRWGESRRKLRGHVTHTVSKQRSNAP